MGKETHLTCLFNETENRLIEAPDIDTQPGVPIGLSFELDKAHVFDKTSTTRLTASPAQ